MRFDNTDDAYIYSYKMRPHHRYTMPTMFGIKWPKNYRHKLARWGDIVTMVTKTKDYYSPFHPIFDRYCPLKIGLTLDRVSLNYFFRAASVGERPVRKVKVENRLDYINQLPVELKLMIIKRVPLEDHINLARTCSEMLDIFEPWDLMRSNLCWKLRLDYDELILADCFLLTRAFLGKDG
jgi:hypothetical protein